MIPNQIDLKPGMVFKSNKKTHTMIINEVNDTTVRYSINNRKYRAETSFVHQFLLQSNWQYEGKELDLAFKELDRKICSHRNIREDRFFSAMVYKTCKDCGATLN